MPRGVRLNPEHDERTRAKIQTSQIINRLEKLVKGEIEMSSQQVRAAEILLRKTLPDMATIKQKESEDNGGLKVYIRHFPEGEPPYTYVNKDDSADIHQTDGDYRPI